MANSRIEYRLDKSQLTAFLSDFEHAYNSIFAFETIADSLGRFARHFPLYLDQSISFELPIRSRRGLRILDWPPTREQTALMVPRKEQLVISSVALNSPGEWEFLGALNPLEVARKYLHDRHERRKDREYRETAEKRRLALEDSILESKAIGERARLLKELGATDRDIAPLIDALLYKPLISLDHHQDNGVIDDVDPPHESFDK